MKKGFLILLMLICAISVNAQKGKSSGKAGKGGAVNNLSIGPIVGVNFSTLRGNDDSKFKAGFSGGIFANYSILENLGITAQVLYSTQGAKSKALSDASIKVNYFQIPVLLMYYLNKPGSTFRPKIMLGPQFGFLSSAKSTTPAILGNGTVTVDAKNFYTDTDISGTLGLGFNYRVGKGMWLNVDARYSHGFENIAKPLPFSSPTANNSVISIMAGISFAFGNYEDL